MGVTAKAAGVFILAAACGSASAQLFKCRDAAGRIVYSDTRCEASASGSALKVVPNSAPDPRAPAAPPAPAPTSVTAKPAGAAEPPPAAGSGAAGGSAIPAPYELTGADRERIRSLEMTLASAGASAEQKQGAQLEIHSIRSGREGRLTRDDRDLRESLSVDLGSLDRKKRADALRRIRELYYR